MVSLKRYKPGPTERYFVTGSASSNSHLEVPLTPGFQKPQFISWIVPDILNIFSNRMPTAENITRYSKPEIFLLTLWKSLTEEKADWYSGGHGQVIDNAVNERRFSCICPSVLFSGSWLQKRLTRRRQCMLLGTV